MDSIALFIELLPLIIPLLFIVLGFAVGKAVEIAHTRDLDAREEYFKGTLTTNLKRMPTGFKAQRSFLCKGQVVVASDYFKTFAAGLRNIIGGRVRSYERLMMRARREALLRMVENAHQHGAHLIINVRMETSNIVKGMGGNQGMPAAEVFAYGTAVVLSE